MKRNPLKLLLASSLSLFALFQPEKSSAQILFSDNFETNSSSLWVAYGGGNGVTNDYSAQFNFTYTNQTFRYNGQILNIPAAPNSTGGTGKGLKVTANKNRPANPRIAAVSLYPKNMVFSNNYALRFDMFMDYCGDVAGGGTGSTEWGTFGINHLGTKVNWYGSGTAFTNIDWPSDGVWFMVTGEGGRGLTAPSDSVAYVGDPTPGPAIGLVGANGGFLWEENILYSDPNAPMSLVLPVPPGQSWGAPGKQWVQVEINQIDGIVTWKMNGYVIASHANGAAQGYTSGTIMLGYSDGLSGVPNPINENYAIFDNVRVVNLGTSGALPTVRLTPQDSDAAEPSDTASFLLERVDKDGNPFDSTNPLTVNLSITGTASNGVDFVQIPTSFVLPAGVQSTNVFITPINDGIGEPTETAIVRILGSANYDIRASFVCTNNIADDGDITSAGVEAIKPIAYEKKRDGKLNVFLSGPAPGDVTVNYTLSGTATNGVHFTTIPLSTVIASGTTNSFVTISPIDDNVINANRTISLRVTSGAGYAVGSASNATVTIRNDDLPTGTVVFTENFDTDTSANWNINKTRANDVVTFGYDYSADGIPPAPGSTNVTKGLKLEANLNAPGSAAGISLSPKNGNYTGDYRIRFHSWHNYPGPLEGGSSDSTEWLAAGVGTTGDHPILQSLGDGIWFDSNGDGSSTIAADFEAFRGSTPLLVGGPVDPWVGGSQAAASPYFAEFGNEVAPQVQIDAGQSGTSYRGSLGFAWRDWVVTKQGTNVTWTVDGLPFASVPTNGATLSSNVFVGYYDASANINVSPQFAFVLIENFRVETLTVTTPRITSVQVISPNVVINFSGGVGDSTNAFTVQSAALVTGSYTNTPATISSLGSTNFQAITPISGSTRFYQIKR